MGSSNALPGTTRVPLASQKNARKGTGRQGIACRQKGPTPCIVIVVVIVILIIVIVIVVVIVILIIVIVIVIVIVILKAPPCVAPSSKLSRRVCRR